MISSIGVASGVGAISISNIEVSQAKGKRLPESHKVFSAVSFEIDDDDDVEHSMKVSRFRTYPHFITKNENVLFVGESSEYDISESENVIATHDSLFDGDSGSVDFQHYPLNSSFYGTTDKIRTDKGPSIDIISQDVDRFEFRLFDQIVSVNRGESKEETISTAVPDNISEDSIDVRIKTHHYGKVKMVTDEENQIFPKTRQSRHFLQRVQGNNQVNDKDSGPRINIQEYQNGYRKTIKEVGE